jgi:predicted hotdog family 3-hydroxylacyl-ACP dehydratase
MLASLVLLSLVGWGIWGIAERSDDEWFPGDWETAAQRYDSIREDAESAERALEANPKDEAAAAKLAGARAYIVAAKAFDPKTGEISEDGGQELIAQAMAAWKAYMKLGPAKPDAGVAMQYARLLSLPTIAKYDQAARAIEAMLVTRKPTSGLYAQLALFRLAEGDRRAYEEARARSLALAPSSDRRSEIRDYLDEQEAEFAEQSKKARAAAADGSSGTRLTPKLPVLPALQ